MRQVGKREPFVTLRPWTLLNDSFHPEAATTLNAAVKYVDWYVEASDRVDGDKGLVTARATSVTASAHGDGRGARVRVPMGLTDAELRHALQPVESASLLHLGRLDGPMLGGFVSAAEGREFEEQIRQWVIPGESRFSGTWCCTHAHYQAGTILYKIPARLPSGPEWAARSLKSRLELREAQLPILQKRECYWDDCRHRRWFD